MEKFKEFLKNNKTGVIITASVAIVLTASIVTIAIRYGIKATGAPGASVADVLSDDAEACR